MKKKPNGTDKKVAAIVLAGGTGKRMGSMVQKQYIEIAGKPLLAYALEAFERSSVDEIIVVTGADDVEFVWNQIVASFHIDKVSQVVPGGKERYHSVYEGLKILKNCDIVLIHDGARPLVTEAIIQRAIDEAKASGASVVGMPVKDTIKVADEDGFSIETPDRNYLWQIQTPQAFSYRLIRQAYDSIMMDDNLQTGITDDAMVVECQTAHRVKLVEGSYENLKVTTPEDLTLVKSLLQSRKK